MSFCNHTPEVRCSNCMNGRIDVTPVQQGWECPKCKAVNAPWVPRCDCKGGVKDGRNLDGKLPWPPDAYLVDKRQDEEEN